MPMKVIIQGGGLAGVTCGIALKQMLGSAATVVILEKSAERVRHTGYIGLWTPALFCLNQLGIYSSIRLVTVYYVAAHELL